MLAERREIIRALRQRVQLLEFGQGAGGKDRVSLGCRDLDKILPEGGLRRGCLVEWLGTAGSGAEILAFGAARQACLEGEYLVVVDRQRAFYPPAAVGWGVELERLLVIFPRTQRDESWALNQVLRCRAVAAVVCWPRRLDSRAFRRLQLAAEAGGSLGLLLRPECVRGTPSWADVQLLVQGQPGSQTARRVRVEVTRCREGTSGQSIELDIDDETGTIQAARPLSVAPELAHPTAPRHAPGA